MEDFLKSLLDWIANNIVAVLAILGLFIEFTPIKLKPISALLSWIGEKTTSDIKSEISSMNREIKTLQDKVAEVEQSNMEKAMDDIRWEILSFASSCRNGIHHTKEEFDHIIKQNDKYEELLKKSGAQNGVYVSSYKYILSLYEECIKKNNFL